MFSPGVACLPAHRLWSLETFWRIFLFFRPTDFIDFLWIIRTNRRTVSLKLVFTRTRLFSWTTAVPIARPLCYHRFAACPQICYSTKAEVNRIETQILITGIVRRFEFWSNRVSVFQMCWDLGKNAYTPRHTKCLVIRRSPLGMVG